ncbi:uncharacterized protein LOC134211503 isoform X1 [Armigeres subalbatus]|uniref:uncharacterized protein LOC134211503 isoform X1 n=1 Tax=Armigeres subalbatus TaxID=124917 RepID=UPI002ED0015E
MLPKRIASKAPKHVASKLLKTAASASKSDSVILSKYAASLTAEHLERYIDKISIVGKDPYLLTMSQSVLPVTVSYESIIEYALHQKSAYTGAGFHCFKAVEAKQRFECGMVKLVEGIRLGVGDLYVVRGKVMHSMKMNEPNLTPWIVINGRNGAI